MLVPAARVMDLLLAPKSLALVVVPRALVLLQAAMRLVLLATGASVVPLARAVVPLVSGRALVLLKAARALALGAAEPVKPQCQSLARGPHWCLVGLAACLPLVFLTGAALAASRPLRPPQMPQSRGRGPPGRCSG